MLDAQPGIRGAFRSLLCDLYLRTECWEHLQALAYGRVIRAHSVPTFLRGSGCENGGLTLPTSFGENKGCLVGGVLSYPPV